MVGGVSLAVFWMPKALRRKRDFIAGVSVCAISMSAALALTGGVIRFLDIPADDTESAITVGYAIGFASLAVIGWIANAFEKREDQDILEVANEVRQVATNRQRRKRVIK